jgi:hypothetical protein
MRALRFLRPCTRPGRSWGACPGALAGSVVAHGRPRVGVSGGDLDVAHVHPGVEHAGAEGVAQHVRAHPGGRDAGGPGEGSESAGGAVSIHPATGAASQDRATEPAVDRSFNRASTAGGSGTNAILSPLPRTRSTRCRCVRPTSNGGEPVGAFTDPCCRPVEYVHSLTFSQVREGSLTNISSNRDSAVLVFHEDRSDIARRALPRLAVGTAGWCLLVVVVVTVQGGTEALRIALMIMGAVWLLAMAMRFDVLALQFGRPIRYELHADRFLAYRGDTVVNSFQFADVKEWTAASSASTFCYWLGWGYWRSGYLISVLPKYSFTLSAGSHKQKNVDPPALFRWQDRGGLGDVTYALFERLGTPLNYSTNYFVDRRCGSTPIAQPDS